MFDLHNFVMAALRGMAGNEPEYKVRQYALGWYDKAQITDDDMAEIAALLTPAATETVTPTETA